MIKKIVSGGQTGVDRAALDAAIKNNIPIGGWCPKGGWAEDFQKPPGVLALYPELKETEFETVVQRTIWNAMDSDASLIIDPNYPSSSRGTDLIEAAANAYHKPYLWIKNRADIPEVTFWLNSLKNNLVLNIGGPRASECEDAYEETYYILNKIFYLTQQNKHKSY